MPVSIKSRLGPYEVLSRIGAGGMGEVYRARDTKLGRDVAIKVLPEAFVRDSERMERFHREAKFLAALNHANIAAIYGVEDAGSTDALVMELAEGPTLADRIASGPIPLAEALPIARQIADALEYAHEHGVVHRDLKPANIKVSREDCVKVLDFGLARAVEGEADATDIRNSPTLSDMATQAGVLLGTAAYMAPEQVKAKPVDRRADIWAFGCVLYEMLSGKKAFAGDSVPETLAAILHNEPDWSQLPSDTPLRVRVLLQRCLQKDPKQRLRDIGDARISLDEVLSGAPDHALAGSPQYPSVLWRRALPWTVATLLFVTSASLAFVHFHQKSAAPAEMLRFQIPLPEKISYGNWVDLSPDGRHLAFSTIAQDGHRQLWIRDLDSLTSRALPGTDGAYIAAWSPDSHVLAFYSENKLKRMDISGGSALVICPAIGPPYYGGTWSPDGVILFGSHDGIVKVSAAGGTPSILIKAHRASQDFLGYPSFLPDGRHFFYSGYAGPNLYAYVGSLDGGGGQEPSKPLAVGRTPHYLPSVGTEPGSLLLLKSDGTLVAQAFDASRIELKGDPTPVVENLRAFAISPNGILAYTAGNVWVQQLTWFDRQGKILGTLGEPGVYLSPAISPNGRTVAVTISDGPGRADIWLFDLQTGTPTRFTFDDRVIFNPVWSPDGSRIAYSSTRTGTAVVYQKPVNGMGKEEAFKITPSHPAAPLDWSRDGRYLIEVVRTDTNLEVWAVQLSPGGASGEARLLPLANEGVYANNALLSPGSKWIAYDSDETGLHEVFVGTFPNPGGKWQVSTHGGTQPTWSRDGKELYYVALDGNLMAVNVSGRPDGSFVAGAPKVLFNPRRLQEPGLKFDVGKDGRFLIASIIQQPAAPITVVVNWRAQANK